MSERTELVRGSGLTKRFGGIVANNAVDRHAAYGQFSRSTCCAISIDSITAWVG